MGALEEVVKESKLDKVIGILQKKFGKNYIGVGSELTDVEYKRLSSGIFSLDYGIGGGLPERKIMMIAGKEGSAKTATILTMIASVQRIGGKVALLNVEHGFDDIWATKLGVQLDKLVIANPSTIEEVSDTIEPLIISGELDLIVLDSIASVSSDKELDESAEKGGRSGNAKANGKMVRKIVSRLNDCLRPVKTSVVLVNQIREKQNIMFGNPEYTPGGHALHHACDIIIWLRPDSKPVGGKENPQGITVKFKCTKNRTSAPFKTGIYNLMFEGKIDEKLAILEWGVAMGVVIKKGYKFTFGDKSVTDVKPFMAALTDDDWGKIKEKLATCASITTLEDATYKEVNSDLEGVV